MVLVRLLLFLALATIAVALGLYVLKRDRRYLRFIGRSPSTRFCSYSAILLFYAFARLRGG